jgi:CubicO group peptidase (beta-lactamase class C family)
MQVRTLMLAALFASSCAFGWFAAPAAAENTQDVIWPAKSWETSSPEQQGMDSAALARLIEAVGAYKQDSLTIVRHGRIVADAYYAPYVPDVSHDLRSVTKSVVSTLAAILLSKGNLDSVDHPVVDLFSDRDIQEIDARKKAMTVQNLLDMTSGIEWVEKRYTPDETIMKMYGSANHTAFVLNQPMTAVPGSSFYYNSGNPYLLSALITKLTGQSAFDYAKKELFEPLGIKSAKWGKVDAQGVTDGESGLSLSPHDMARIGYLYLHDGQWEGRRIIPSSWVERVKSGPVTATFGLHYGNLWWSLPEKGAYMALGRHSQHILVIPKFDVVVAMTGYLNDTENYSVSSMVDAISSAVKSDQPLPDNPVAQALLAKAIHRAAEEKPYAVGDTPALAKTISGSVYNFADNKLRVKSFTLNFYDSDASWVLTTYGDERDGRFTGMAGLDGAFRRSPPAPYGINAARGRWTGEHTFVMERRILGHGETQTWALTFDGDQVTVNFENTDGLKAELHGVKGE